MNTGVLLPYQQAWIADRNQVKVCEKSRRVGLSWAEAANSALEAAKANGQDTWYIGYNKEMAEEFIRDVAFWAGHYQLAAAEMEEEVIADERGDILAFKIRFASGFRVTALSSRPSNLRGKQGRVIIDEAAFHMELGELLKAAMALLIWGGSVSIISTHNGVDNPFNELINDIRAGKLPYSLHRITFDDAVKQGLCKRVFMATKKEWSPESQKEWVKGIRNFYRPNEDEELDCIPAQSGGQYISRALIESRMNINLPILRLSFKDDFSQLPEDVRYRTVLDWCKEHLQPVIDCFDLRNRHCYGMDFGRTGDLSIIKVLEQTQSIKHRVVVTIELRNVPFKQQEQILFYLVDRLPRFMGGANDARGNGQYIAEVAAQRYSSAMVHQVMLSRSWYLQNMPRMKAAFEDDEIEIPRDADILDDLRAIVVDKGVPMVLDTKNSGSDGKQRHGDSAISLCLGLFAARNAAAPIEFERVPMNAPASRNSYFGALNG